MKISEALLYSLREAGCSVQHTQFQVWLGQLMKSGFIDTQLRPGKDGVEEVYYVLTDKAKDHLKGKGI
jgi:DNA-binding PadR family transcriptional regulator